MTAGYLSEVFTSYQGEGPLVGIRQFFVRLSICHMRCVYCDSPETWGRSDRWREELEPHSGRFEERENPASVTDVCAVARRHLSTRLRYHSLSITGGEPLLQSDFLRELLPALKEATELPAYLETSGTLPARLDLVAPWIDFFSLDIKPPSTPGVRADWDEIEACLRIAAESGREAFAKIVVMEQSPTEEEVSRACRILARAGRVGLVFTPVTPVNPACATPTGARLGRLRRAALAEGIEPIVVPQLHRIAGWH